MAIEHSLAPPCYPQINGMVERFNGCTNERYHFGMLPVCYASDSGSAITISFVLESSRRTKLFGIRKQPFPFKRDL